MSENGAIASEASFRLSNELFMVALGGALEKFLTENGCYDNATGGFYGALTLHVPRDQPPSFRLIVERDGDRTKDLVIGSIDVGQEDLVRLRAFLDFAIATWSLRANLEQEEEET